MSNKLSVRMGHSAIGRWLLACGFLVSSAVKPAAAQGYEASGIRAQGMGGAFVAVANEASLTWWNPAGLATGALFSGIVEHSRAGESEEDRTLGLSIAIPSLGLSYYRLRMASGAPATSIGVPNGGRQDTRETGTRLPVYIFSQFGVTVGQSLGEHLVLGSTLKLVHVDQTAADLDVGVMGTFGPVRATVVAKSLRDPDLTAEGTPVSPGRRVRAGAAYIPPARGSVSWLAAIDADLSTNATALGDERRLAGGVEVSKGRIISVRGGVNVSTIGDRRDVYSAGTSVGVSSRFYVDAQITRGHDELLKRWGLALRVTF